MRIQRIRAAELCFVGSVGILDIFLTMIFGLLGDKVTAEAPVPVRLQAVDGQDRDQSAGEALVITITRTGEGAVYELNGRRLELEELVQVAALATREGKGVEIACDEGPLIALMVALHGKGVASVGFVVQKAERRR